MVNIKQLQECQLEILKELDRVCKLHKLTYCLAFGSCLGAIRHQGFIPWDDDIDVYMLADDFEKLKLCVEDFREGFFLQDNETDEEYGLMISRLRNSNTTLIEKNESYRDINHGVFVDIYPLFQCPENKLKARWMQIHAMLYRLFLYGVAPQNRGAVMKIGSTIILKLTPAFVKKAVMKHTYKQLKKTNNSGLLSTFYGDEAKIAYPKEWLWPPVLTAFEDVQVPVPANADKYLSFTYGDYMKLPPSEKQTVHHTFEFVDLKTSYVHYKGQWYCKDKSNT